MAFKLSSLAQEYIIIFGLLLCAGIAGALIGAVQNWKRNSKGALIGVVKNRKMNSKAPYPDVDGANIVDPNVPIPSPESAQSRQSDNASSIPTLPPIYLSRFHVSRSEMPALIPSQTSSPTTPPSSSGLPLTQTSPTDGAMSEGPGGGSAHLVQQPGSDAVAMAKGSRTELAHLVQQPGSDAVGFLQYEDSVSIRVPPTAYIAV